MPAEIVDRLTAMLPTGRMAEPAEVAALVAFLASEEAGYVTGEAIAIDGGAVAEHLLVDPRAALNGGRGAQPA